jgi:deoxyribodipyrimidine photo-lyase
MADPAQYDAALVWFRRDLRFSDHAALYHALKACRRVWCVFVFDTEILDGQLKRGLNADRRVEFIHESLCERDDGLRRRGGGMIALHGSARALVPCALAAGGKSRRRRVCRDYPLPIVEHGEARRKAL